MPSSHPSPNELAQLATGALSDPPASDIESHVLECPECQKATAEMRIGDTFVEGLRQAARPDEQTGELDAAERARVERIIGEVSGMRPKSEAAPRAPVGTAEKDLLAEMAGVWRPAESEGELGRLGGYRILRLLGAGGMGGVFLAEDPQLKRQVALKVIRPHAAAMAGAADRFLREAQAAAAVRHDNVVTIYQVGQDHNVPFIAQELLTGETLEERLVREKSLPSADATDIARQVAAGLGAAHDRGLMHRDIKPANIWLEPAADEHSRPRVKILDFGLARTWADDTQQLTQSGMIVGTPAYMSPEQAAGQPLDARADLFSLGAVLYRMLTGTSPFARANAIATLHALAVETPKPPSEVLPSVSGELSALVLALLAKKPEERPASARRVREQLLTILTAPLPALPARPATETRVPADEPTALRPAAKPAFGDDSADRPRNPWLIALGFGSLAAALVLGIVIIVRNQQGDEVGRINVPEGGSVTIEPDGKTPKKPGETIPPAIKPAPEPVSPSSPTPPPKATPSPFDALDPAAIPEAERYPWQPKELVAVIGSHKRRSYGSSYMRAVPTSDGQRIVTTLGDIFDVASGRRTPLTAEDPIWIVETQVVAAKRPKAVPFDDRHASITPDGKRFASRYESAESKDAIRVWDLIDGEFQPVVSKQDCRHCALSASGTLLAVSRASDNVVEVYDIVGAELKRRCELRGPEGVLHDEVGQRRLGFLPDGRLVTLAGDSSLTVWDVSGTEAKTVATDKGVDGSRWNWFALSKDGRRLCACDQGGVGLYEIGDNSLVKRSSRYMIDASYMHVQSAAFLPDGNTLVTGHMNGAVRLWDISGDEIVERDPVPMQPWMALWGGAPLLSPDGRYLASMTATGHLAAWKLRDSAPHPMAIESEVSDIQHFGFLPASNRIIAHRRNKQSIESFELTKDAVTQPSSVAGLQSPHLTGTQIVLDPAGDTMVVKMAHELVLYRRENGQFKEVGRATCEGDTHGLRFAAGNKILVRVAGHTKEELTLWDVKKDGLTKQVALPVPSPRLPAVSPDGQMLAVGCTHESKIFLWTLRDGKPTRPDVFDPGHSENCVSFDPTGKRLASGGSVGDSRTGQVILWDVATGQRLREINGGRQVISIQFAPDGRHLITGNADGTIYVLRL